LGSINGVNTATADTLVGIGTSTPTSRLQIVNNNDFSFLVESNAPLGAGIELKSNRSTMHNWLIYTGDTQNFNNLFFLDKTTNQVVMSLRGDPSGGGVVNVDGFVAKSIFMDSPPQNGDAPLCLNSSINRIALCSDPIAPNNKKDAPQFANLANTVKEQQTKIETQEKQNLEQQTKIEAQQKQLDEQKTMIEGLKKFICQTNPQAEVCKESK